VNKAPIIILMIFLAGAAFASISSPEGLVAASGLSESSGFDNFAVVGDNVAGLISDALYTSGVGLAAAIFTPLLPQAGQPVPTIPTSEGEVVSYPSPFNPDLNQSTTVSYKLSQDVEVKVLIYDITGQLIKTIITNSANRWSDGYSRISWDGKSGFGEAVDNGVYLVRIVSEGKIIGKTKVLVIR